MSLLIFYCMLSSLMHTSIQGVTIMAQGRIRGVPRDGYTSYVGVPYASVNANGRFKNAGTAPTWRGIRESREPYCTTRSEVQDCLQLDVHVPNVGESWPILVWVKGSSGDYHPGMLVQEGIIVVTVRHRIGAIGFMCSQEDTIPGNVGVKDVILALRWVRDNIVAFKGNPHRVVVAGQSFGAAMVEALTLSSMARGLYHGVIMQSGTIMAPWAFDYDANDKTRDTKMAMNGTESLLRSEIADIVVKSEELDVPYFSHGICIEKAFKSEERLLSEAPFNTFMRGKHASVPVMIGYNSNEAYIFVSTLREMKAIKEMTTDATSLLPVELQAINERETKPLNKQLANVYFEDNVTISSLLEYYRDAYFLSHIHRSAKFHATSGAVFYYQFSYSGRVGVEPEEGLEKAGAAHSDELGYFFPTDDIDFDEDDAIVHRHLVQLWTNFVKNLNPNNEQSAFQWSPLDPREPRLLDIHLEPAMVDYPHRERIEMWEDIYERLYFRRH